jgi:3-oxoacyl-[acyl-carrier-protein] synthase-3
MKFDDVLIAGVGAHIPPAEPAGMPGWTGVAVAGDVSAPDLAVQAAKQAIAQAMHEDSEFAVLIHAGSSHQGPDFWPAHSYIQRHTIGGDAPAMEIRQSCNGMLAAIELAGSFLVAQNATAALVTAADNFGHPLVDRRDYASGAATNRPSILGDGATAVVLSRREGFARLRAVRSTSVPWLEEMYRSGIPLFPPCATVGRTVHIGDRIAHYSRTKDFTAAKLALRDARTDLAKATLAEAGVDAGQITRVTHVFSGGEPYIHSILAPLGIDTSRGMLEFGRSVGHLGPNDHVAALDHLLTTGSLAPGDHVLMLSNGGGSLTAVVIEML